MGWCPKCKNEFVDSVKICPKCEIELTTKDRALAAVYDEFNDSINYTDTNDDNNEEEYENTEFFNAVNSKEYLNGKDYSYDCEEITAIEFEELDKRAAEAGKVQKNKINSSVYQDKKSKALDVKNSAISLIIVGVVGLIIVVLVFTGVVPLHQSLYGKIITCSVMGFLFLCLIIMGFFSIKSFKNLKDDASDEDKLTEEIEKWYKSSLNKNLIDEGLFNSEELNMSDEEKYFKRYAKIYHILNQNFVNLDTAYSEHMAEEIFQFIFDNED